MKKILFILLLACTASAAHAQFPTKDSLMKFINKYVRNSPVDAFTGLRLNTAMLGSLNFADSVGIRKTEMSGSTFRIITVGKDTFSVEIVGGGGGSNTNVGTGFRIAVSGTANIKTIFSAHGLL